MSLGGRAGYEFMPNGNAASLDGLETWSIYAPYGDASMRRGDNRNVLVRRPNGEWILFNTDGTEFHFDSVCDTCSSASSDPLCQDASTGGKARLTRVVNATGSSVSLTYDRPVGLLLAVSDDLGHTLRLESGSACGTGLASTLRYDSVVVASYSYLGLDLDVATDADGSILRSYAYDTSGTGRLLAVKNEAGEAIAQFSYDAAARAIGVVDRMASVSVDYDSPGGLRVTEYFGNNSSTSVRQLDPDGYTTSISDGCACGPPATLQWQNRRLACRIDTQGRIDPVLFTAPTAGGLPA